MDNILIIDDDCAVFNTLAVLIKRMGCKPVWQQTLSEGLEAVEQGHYDVVLLDVHLPDGYGLDIVTKIRQTPSEPEVIIMTGYGDSNGAEIAINNGAWDYIQKTGSIQEVTLSLKRVLEYQKEKIKHCPTPVALKLDGIIGESKPLKACYDQLAKAAVGDANVLISGETGTGKEIFARAIHANSSRANANLVIVDCAALPESLVESLLFGHVKGVYTGADKAREGLIAQADGGTLFLDEVGELPPAIQKVFLRVLQERKYRPVGGQKELPSNFRLVAATNRNLDKMVDAGHFRKDLLYRLRTINMILPPLKERSGDIKRLVSHYLSVVSERYDAGNKGASTDFLEALDRYTWPGNVRELINALETAISNAGPELVLYSRHLPNNIRLQIIQRTLEKKPKIATPDSIVPPSKDSFLPTLTTFKTFRKTAISKIEKEYLKTLLDHTHNSLNKALHISGLSRSRFYDLLKQNNLSL